MAEKARALIYRRADGERGQILGSPDIWSDELCSVLNGAYWKTMSCVILLGDKH